tara:strand:- start:1032 stop:1334 length:303 start_codon:yes stop_codon:yes gene_type:complete
LDWVKEGEFFKENKHRVGTNTVILFDRGRINEAIYSCEIVKIRGEVNGVKVYVRFHYDKEPKKYDCTRFVWLENECQNFMKKRGIILQEFVGKISTHPRF